MKAILSLLLLLLPVAAHAQITMGGNRAASAVNGFTYARKITIDHTKIPNTALPPSDLSNFPVLFDSKIDAALKSEMKTLSKFGGAVTCGTACDVVFYPDALCGAGEDKLDHEVDYYDGPSGEFVAHIEMNLSHTADTDFWICYGKSAITTSQENVTGTWNGGYQGIYHFGAPTSLRLADSTTNANDGTNDGAVPTAGKVAGAASFALVNSINLGNPASLRIEGSITVELWYHINAEGTMGLYQKYLEADGGGISVDDQLTQGVTGYITGPVVEGYHWGSAFAAENVAPVVGDTKHVSYVYDSAAHTIRLDVNGIQVATYDYYAGITPTSANAIIGGVSGTNGLNGWVDELRISNVARSSDWRKTSYLMQLNPALMVSVGPRL